MQQIKRLAFLSFVLFCIVALYPAQSNAAEFDDLPPLPTTGTPSPDLKSGIVETELKSDFEDSGLHDKLEGVEDIAPFAKTKYLKSGTSMIIGDGGSVRVRGTTDAFQNVSSISVNVKLEYWSASKNKWISVPATNKTNYYSKSIMASAVFNVSKGYYYRTRSEHRISHAGTEEKITTISTYIYL